MSSPELAPGLVIAEAGRVMMAQQAEIIVENGAIICKDAEITAVHEMRKAIRRTFTCFKLFNPYFKPGTIRKYKRGLRQIMRRLGYSRDLAVFRLKLTAYNEKIVDSLTDLEAYWQSQQIKADEKLTLYLAAKKRQDFLTKYVCFTKTPGKGALPENDPWAPVKISHIAPILIYQRVAAVRALGGDLDNATVTQLHKLRIQFKELRYALQFFTPILGDNINEVLVSLEQSQEHLGDLNDAKVALELLAKANGFTSSTVIYRGYQEKELQRLIKGYWPVWQEFDQFQWRQNLAGAVAVL